MSQGSGVSAGPAPNYSRADEARPVTRNDAGCERPATAMEMAQHESHVAQSLRSWVENYIAFPTEGNRAGVADRMSDYLASWMNGRKRVL